jgi:hypothetical protein
MLSTFARSSVWLRVLQPRSRQHEGAPTGEAGEDGSACVEPPLTTAVVSGGTVAVWAESGFAGTPCGWCGVPLRIGDRARAVVVFAPGVSPPDEAEDVLLACLLGEAGFTAAHEGCALELLTKLDS